MKALIVSKGVLNVCFDQLLQSLPLADKNFSVLNVYPQHRQRRGSVYSMAEQNQFGVGMRTNSSVAAESTTALSVAYPEVVAKTGSFIKETIHAINLQKPELVVLTQEIGQVGSMARLAADGIRIFNRGKASVLLLPAACSMVQSSRVVVGTPALGSGSDINVSSVSSILSSADAEIIVTVVANPFYPPFSRVIPTMRGCQSRAIREIHDEQAVEATAQAEMIANQLASGKSKSLYVGRTGRLVPELSQVVRSNETALLCLLIASSSRKLLNKSKLLEMLENVDVPILLASATER